MVSLPHDVQGKSIESFDIMPIYIMFVKLVSPDVSGGSNSVARTNKKMSKCCEM